MDTEQQHPDPFVDFDPCMDEYLRITRAAMMAAPSPLPPHMAVLQDRWVDTARTAWPAVAAGYLIQAAKMPSTEFCFAWIGGFHLGQLEAAKLAAAN